MADITNLTNFLGDIADAIRTKKETTEQIPAENFDQEILSIETGIDTSDATATSNDLVYPKTAYANGTKIVGAITEKTEPLGVTPYKIRTSIEGVSDLVACNEDDIVLFTSPENLYVYKYDTDTERLYDTVYEPLPHHYQKPSDGGYSTPSTGFFVFLATEDMDVVFCGHATSNPRNCGEIKYGTFIQIADNLLSINGELMKVIVEAITKNRKDIESLYEKTRSLGDIHVTSIDSDEFPSVQGEPMVIVADRYPNTPTNTHGLDVPNRIGQIWIDKSSGRAYIATSLGDISGWKQITLT